MKKSAKLRAKDSPATKVQQYEGWASGSCIVVGISGGIAAYKTASLVNQFKYAGADVHVIMTEHATKFITPFTLQVLSKNPVRVGMFDFSADWTMEHIDLADRANVVVVAPATANLIGKVAHGLADDMLSTTIMSTTAPVVFCPSMNVHMYANRFVQANLRTLTQAGYHMVEPRTGPLACDYQGKGRLAEVDAIVNVVRPLVRARR